MDSGSGPRRRIVEVSPRLDYLGEVAREIGLHFRMEGNKDPYLERIYSQLTLKKVRGGPSGCFFRFDRERGKHWKGEEYEYRHDGKLRLVSCTPPVRDALRWVVTQPADPEVALPGPDSLTARDLLDAIDLLLVQQVLSA